jgi:hypothetical protein
MLMDAALEDFKGGRSRTALNIVALFISVIFCKRLQSSEE